MSGDTMQSLGEYLRQERERRGITIEQVASATKIGIKTLHSIEADEFVDLPAKPFIRGFVTSYARFIGLDPKEILTRFGGFIDTKAHDRPNREAGHSGYAFEKRESDQSRTVLWIVMGGFVAAGGLAAIFIKKPLGHHHGGSHADKLKAVYGVAPSPVPGASVSPAASPSALAGPLALPSVLPSQAPLVVAASPSIPVPQGSPSAAPMAESDEGPSPDDPLNSGIKLKATEIKHRVVFKAVESAWIRYQCDHRPVTSFIFLAGKVLVLRARESIKFQVSPPKAITFSYKGSGFKPLVGDQHLVSRQNDATIFFPFELADSIREPFPGEAALSGRVVPSPRPSASLSPAAE